MFRYHVKGTHATPVMYIYIIYIYSAYLDINYLSNSTYLPMKCTSATAPLLLVEGSLWNRIVSTLPGDITVCWMSPRDPVKV